MKKGELFEQKRIHPSFSVILDKEKGCEVFCLTTLKRSINQPT